MNSCIDFSQTPVTSVFGINSFSNAVMRERLPKNVFRELLEVQSGDKELTLEVAEVVAGAMKDWAIEKGATHYTHWFQPLTGLTAEKHESFIAPTAEGKVLMEFSGKELIKGEPDASSFPSGGLRATFEARGYTAWDTTSPAFLKQDPTGTTLCIPTAFVGYYGHALDKKVPLLKAMAAINRQAMRVLRALGNTASTRVISTMGPEQEYFLVDKALFDRRPDLLLTGRTVFGSMPAKGQEMEDHYYGAIKERVALFMRELNYELWKVGVAAKTQHNEVAPNQFELAPIYASSNVAADANQLVMETIQKVARRHGMEALLHEKPFAGVNGSGKHNNWSLATDDGLNLLEPGDDPSANARFLLFAAAVVAAVDRYATLIRSAAATAGNDHRLGANEAPPAIISIFFGSVLSDVLDALADGKAAASRGDLRMQLGVTSLPSLPLDLSDRNRTSPFAFTGNKFEFRMVGSSQSIATANTYLNTAVSQVLAEFADRLEAAADKAGTMQALIKEYYGRHRRVVFNGNGYAEDWVAEAARRGLPNIRSTVDALAVLVQPATVELFETHLVLTRAELESRYHIYLEKYSKQINIEAGVMIDMVRRQVFPAGTAFAGSLAQAAGSLAAIGAISAPQEKRAKRLAELLQESVDEADRLERVLAEAQETAGELARAKLFLDKVVPQMVALRARVDPLEKLVAKDAWPLPTYEDLLFRL
ncbi:MAG: glutamine synthetase [Spirochaetes bacterium GWD1_61_31]|nr:MAG: glutamine synthetase [Spirochaetes bacterium GWB1_60_80]OHD29773.1 MAG: glutamine synthetase [Spirochaetes bacterium GWC1_61_12]OHD42885.1 MAG: glutamine synthetase [Spirochaetes bacterium GWE1_60_18]OHD43462.1 MAG: glutamine synthetase [Spirochaetes bacterium GWD1_61_31]OHD59577.1 MAG: glutamine synthetase [Spirochaetes bacterium GWF1_60_12]